MKTAHEQTLKQRIEALRDDVESISLHNHIYGDGEGISASVVVARLTDALAESSPPFPKMAERLTHAELAEEHILLHGPLRSSIAVHLDTAAEIERVAREVVSQFGTHHQPDDCAICRLRALVQP